jgi:hypothetical protein
MRLRRFLWIADLGYGLDGWGEDSFLQLISQEVAGTFKLSMGAAKY